MDCPRCHAPLGSVRHGEYAAHPCARCGAVFLAGDLAHAVAAALDVDNRDLAAGLAVRAQLPVETVLAVSCPVCAAEMKRRRIGMVDVDVCFAHGTFYDRGELERVAAHLEQRGAGLDPAAPPADAPSPPPSSPAPVGVREVFRGLLRHR